MTTFKNTMKITPCPHCGKPINPAAILGAVGGSMTSPAKIRAARANGRAGGGRPVGAKDSKPRKPRALRDKRPPLGPGNRPNFTPGQVVTLKYSLNPTIQPGHKGTFHGCRKDAQCVSGYRVKVQLDGSEWLRQLDAHFLEEYQP